MGVSNEQRQILYCFAQVSKHIDGNVNPTEGENHERQSEKGFPYVPQGQRPFLTFINSRRWFHQQPMLPNPTVSSVTLKVDQVCDHVYACIFNVSIPPVHFFISLFFKVRWNWCAVHWLIRCKERFMWARHCGAMPSKAFCVRVLVMASGGQLSLGCIVRAFPLCDWLLVSVRR